MFIQGWKKGGYKNMVKFYQSLYKAYKTKKGWQSRGCNPKRICNICGRDITNKMKGYSDICSSCMMFELLCK